MGLPVVGHDIGGIRDYVIDEVTGWLCKRNEADEYAAVFKRIMLKPLNRRKIQ